MSDFSESTAMVRAGDSEEEDQPGSLLGDAISGGVKGALGIAKGAKEAAKGLTEGMSPQQKRKKGMKQDPDELMLWVMEYLKKEQETVHKRNNASLEFLQTVLKNMQEVTKEQSQLNSLVEETMELVSTTIAAEQRRARSKMWWEWLRDIIMIGLTAGSFVRLGQVATNQQLLIGRQVGSVGSDGLPERQRINRIGSNVVGLKR